MPMPLYVYTCPACDIVLEELRPVQRSDDPVECPLCHRVCVREISHFSLGRDRVAQEWAGVLPRSRVTNHGDGCACCRPNRRG